MSSIPVWNSTATSTAFEPLRGDGGADVVVVGGGITGCTLALLLAEAGRSVVLLEARTVGSGDTGYSTGNLYQTVSGGLHEIRDTWSDDVLRSVAASRGEAVDFIERQARAMAPEDACFRRCDMFLFAGSGEAGPSIDREHDAARAAGLAAHREMTLPAGAPTPKGVVLRLEQQAQFQPLGYVRALAQRAAAAGCRLHEHSPVVEFDASKGQVRTEAGRVDAREVVLATHSPIGIHAVQAGMEPRREYGVAFPIAQGAFPPGVFWEQGGDQLSLRSLDTAKGSHLICIGQNYKTGDHDSHAALQQLEQQARQRLNVQEASHRWSAQHFHSPDELPFVGKDLSGAWIATGYATDGLTWGTLAACIIGDRLLGRENRWSEVFRTGRFDPVKAGKRVFQENVSVAKAFVQDYLTHRQSEQLATLPLERGAIVELDGERVAAYRDGNGTVHAVSPVCTHMKCLVHWNALETSWDCPCHGSRFAPDGRVLEGPAYRPLERKRLPAQES